MAYTLGGTTLPNIQTESVTKDAQLFQMAIPRSSSSRLVAFDIFGASRTISIDGYYTTSDGTIATFISWLDGLVSGVQSSKSYASDTSGTSYTVVVQTTEWSKGAGEVSHISYKITMLECAKVT
jgi:hypothetical protein